MTDSVREETDAAVTFAVSDAVNEATDAEPISGDGAVSPLPSPVESADRNIVFVDPSVGNVEALLAQLGPGVEVCVLDGQSDGLAQIASRLESGSSNGAYNSVHIISHGSPGSISLGSLTIDGASLSEHESTFVGLRQSLSENADILLYGCDVAVGPEGAAFVANIARLTGADVAASSDLTGASVYEGNAVLEVQTGEVTADPLFDQVAWNSLNLTLATTITGTYFDGNANFTFTIARSDGGQIVPNTKTWVLIHGYTGNAAKMQSLANAVDDKSSDQVLILDWSQGATEAASDHPSNPGYIPGSGPESRIPFLATGAAIKLLQNFHNSDLSFIGHSFGANVAAEIAKDMAGSHAIIALDPATNIPLNSYDPNSSVNFASFSDFSWGFYGTDTGLSPYNWFGNEVTAKTADEAIVVKNSGHVEVKTLFENMLRNPTAGNGAGQFFQLDRIAQSNPSPGPWIPNQYDLDGHFVGSGDFEAIVYATSGGTMPNGIDFQYAEVTVQGNAVIIVDGDASPISADGTDFGSVTQGTVVDHVFRVNNTGNAALTTSVPILPAGFTLVEPLSTNILSGSFDTFTVRLDTANQGPKSGQISFTTNDPDETPFNFQITAAVLPPPPPSGPEITVLGNGFSILDNDGNPSTGDHTDFGSTTQSGGVIDRVFTVVNSGSSTLTISNFAALPSGFSLVEGLSSSIAPSGNDTFTVRLDTAVAGNKSGQIQFNTNDSDENPFNFSIAGMVNSPTATEIAVSWGGTDIADGDATPSAGEGTDFGAIFQGGATVDRAFLVSNTGSATLTISNFQLPTGFISVEPLSTSIAPGNSDYFTVRLDSATTGMKTGDIQFNTNDASENPFNFRVTGTVNSASSFPTFHIAAASADKAEASSGGATSFTFTITRTGLTNSRQVVLWQGAFPIPNVPAATGNDFPGGSFPDGFEWFEIGETTHTITVDVIADSLPESDEYFDILLTSSSVGSQIGTPRATGIIRDDDTPEIAVSFSGTLIGDGDASPSSGEGSDFGTVTQGSPAVQRIYTVQNLGTSTLTLGVIGTPSGFALIEGLPASVAAGGSDTFTVQLNTGTANTFMGDISFSTNDSDENPFNFRITGTVTAPAEIAVSGNGTTIADGDVTPSSAEQSDFGSVVQGGSVVQRTFTVQNLGGSALTLGAVNLPSGFSVVEGLSSPIAAGSSDTFTVQLNTGTANTFTGDISFSTNDSDENPFNFRITGTVTSPPPPAEIAVSGNGTNVADGDTTPSSAEQTDFGSVVQGGGAAQRIFTVQNIGGSTLTLGAVSLPAGFSLVEGLLSLIAAGNSDTFTVQLDIGTANTFTGDISFSTNDSNENPFNFRITGTVTPPSPAEIAVSGSGTNIADGDTTPSSAEQTDFGSVTQGGAAVQRTFSVQNIGGSTLTLGALSPPSGFTLVEGLSSSIGAGGSDTFTVQLDTSSTGTKNGQITLSNNDSDENPFNFSITGTVTSSNGHGTDVVDFDGDGKADIVFQNSNGQVSQWLINGTSVSSAATLATNPGAAVKLRGSADFDGDGSSDLLFQNTSGQAAIWLMNGPSILSTANVGGNPGTAWKIKGPGDFNGDGFADILWQHDSGQAAIWLMNGLTPTLTVAVGGNSGAAWKIKGSGDFDGDGKADILWQNDGGQAAIWLMNGLTPTVTVAVGSDPGPTWHVVGSGDFNGDGKADILWQNDSGQAAIWLMNGVTPTTTVVVGTNPGATWHVKGAGDFNGDGKSDILWQNDSGQARVWLMNGLTPTTIADVGSNLGAAWEIANYGVAIAPPPPAHEAERDDFNADGKADLLLQNTSGQAAIWLMNGATPATIANVGSNPGTAWKIKASGDFNGDSKADILLQNTSGQAAIWFVNGTTLLSTPSVGSNPGSAWKIKSAGDFDGDGKSDILWQNDNGQAAIWMMDGTTLLSTPSVGSNPGPSWKIKTTGDFDGDGRSDILWQNDNGQAAIWLMNGTTPTLTVQVGSNPGTAWHIKGAGDFNGDGKADILWQNDSGQAAIWLMNGVATTSTPVVGTNPGTAWQVKGAHDVDGDGKADILWQNTNGQAMVWLMNGTSVLSTPNAGSNPGAAWQIVASAS